MMSQALLVNVMLTGSAGMVTSSKEGTCHLRGADLFAIRAWKITLLLPGGPVSCTQVIFCAAARTPITADLLRVDDRGVANIAKAMQVCSLPALQLCSACTLLRSETHPPSALGQLCTPCCGPQQTVIWAHALALLVLVCAWGEQAGWLHPLIRVNLRA